MIEKDLKSKLDLKFNIKNPKFQLWSLGFFFIYKTNHLLGFGI